MKGFETIPFDPKLCFEETRQLQDLLANQSALKERQQILPFFKERKHRSVFLGSCHPDIVHYESLAYEFSLFGDFTCDLVVGDSENKAFVFVEIEDAASDSIFVKKSNKATPEWSPRFEHGFSQIVDWFFKLHDQDGTIEFENAFGTRTIKHSGLLIVGRDEALGVRESQRLRWRQECVLVNSRHIYCKTFDQIAKELTSRLLRYPEVAKLVADEKKSSKKKKS